MSKSPVSQENYWISTPAGSPYFLMFRFYGSEKGAIDGSSLVNDAELVK